MKIAGHEIGPGHPPFIIGEAGMNHGGSIDKALEMVRVAKNAGCDACKFQTYRAAEFCAPDDPMYATFERCELPVEAWTSIKAMCDKLGIIFLSTPQNRSDLDILLKVGIPAIKVGSDDFCNEPLLSNYTSEGLPMILSCGMSDLQDVRRAIYVTRESALMVCTSQYPTPAPEANLARISLLRECWPGVPIGFSDHTLGSVASLVAVGLGACIFERHFMLNDGEAPDALFAIGPDGLAGWATDIRLAHTMLGDGYFTLTDRERESKRLYQRRPGAQIRGAA